MAANAESTTSELLAIEAGRHSPPDAARLLMDADDRTVVEVLRSLNPAIAQDILDDIPDERRGPHYLRVCLTVWLSLIGVVAFGSVAGSMLPFILRRLGFDPATSSAPFVATLVDVTGLIIYFTVAAAVLQGVTV